MRKMRRRIVAGVLALTLATGCAEGTKYECESIRPSCEPVNRGGR